MTATVFCIFINTLANGSVPSQYGGNGYPCTYATEREAQLEIAELALTRLREFVEGLRDFDDAMTIEEYVETCELHPDGSISTEDGGFFGKQ